MERKVSFYSRGSSICVGYITPVTLIRGIEINSTFANWYLDARMGRIEEGRRKEIGTIERSEWTRGGKWRLFEVGRNPDARKKERDRIVPSDISIFIFTSPCSFQSYPFSIPHIHILILDPKIGKHGRLHDNPHRGEKKSKRIGWPIFRRIFLPEEG